MSENQSIRRILVGLDGGDPAGHALLAGLSLARSFEARVEIMHVVSSPPEGPDSSLDPLARATRNACALTLAWTQRSAHVEHLAEQAGFDPEQARKALRVVPGHPAKVLIEQAEQEQVDLLVLGTHRRRGLFDFGSTTRAILARFSGGIWIQSEAVAPIRTILAPIDLSRDSLRACQLVADLARQLSASVRVVHVCDAPPGPEGLEAGTLAASAPGAARSGWEAERQRLERRLAAFLEKVDWSGVRREVAVLEGDPVSRILEQQATADMVLMGTHGQTGLWRAVLGGVAYGVLKNAYLPVLALPLPGRDWLLDTPPIARGQAAAQRGVPRTRLGTATD